MVSYINKEKAIIVAPLTLIKNWNNEFKKWIGDTRLAPLLACGNKDTIDDVCQRFTMGKHKVLIISYEQFISHSELLSGKCDLLIFDEGHRLKNDKTKSLKVIQKFQCARRIILTGTPLQNKLEEFYTCVSLVNPGVFESLQKFKQLFSDKIIKGMRSDASEEDKFIAAQRSKTLTQLIQQFVLRRKADILEKLLPPKYEYFVLVRLTDLQREIYQKIVDQRQKLWNYEGLQMGGSLDVFGLLTVMRKLLNHPLLLYQDENKTAQEFKHLFPSDEVYQASEYSTKFIFIQQICQSIKQANVQKKHGENQEKVIIVSYWTQTLDLVQNLLNSLDLQFVRLDGKISGQKRQEAVDKFQNRTSNYTVFLLCAKAGGVGLNLTAANRMIMMEADWNPSNDAQVMGRIWRDGQNLDCHMRLFRKIYYYSIQYNKSKQIIICCGTVEERIIQRQQQKESMSMNVVDEEKVVKSFNNDELKKLFFFKNDEKSITFQDNQNDLEKFESLIPDYAAAMKNYINFVKINYIKKEEKQEVKNEFENDNIFMKTENEPEQEEDDEDEEEENELEFQELANNQLIKASQLEDQENSSSLEMDAEITKTPEKNQQSSENDQQTIPIQANINLLDKLNKFSKK